MEEELRTPHIMVLPGPGMGHVIPHLEFAKRLVTLHNIHVTFLVISTDSSAAQSHHLRHHQSAATAELLRLHYLPPLNISHLLTPPPTTPIQTRMSLIIQQSLPDIRSAILSSSPPTPTALVSDFFATAAFSLPLPLPHFLFFTSSAAELAFMMHLPALHRRTPSEYVQLTEPIQVPGCNPIRIEDLVDPVLDRSNDSYKWFLLHATRFPQAAGIIVNTCDDLEPMAIKALRENPILRSIPTPRVYPVGPLINLDGSAVAFENSELKRWLDAQRDESVVYVSFGSGGTLSAEQMGELAHGLELSRQRFVWVVRRPFEDNASGTYFDVGGGGEEEEAETRDYLPDGFVERVKFKGVGVVIPSWAPQVEILRHRACGGFLSHCGWNLTLESVAHGVPVIAWPLYAEQKMNATMLVEELGVGIRVQRRGGGGPVVGREEIERAVRILMDSEEGKAIRGKVKELGERVMRAREEGGSSFNSLCEIAQEWKDYAMKGIV